MERTVYFADKALKFTDRPVSKEWFVAIPEISRTKIEKILETHNRVAIVSADCERLFADFAARFTWVEAAGGVVANARGAWLMILRNGRWDFPKGHVEAGETVETAAVREIFEETGVSAEVVRPLCRTLHAYYFEPTARWELKRTHWFALRAVSEGELVPQTEEGIACAAWCSPAEVADNLRGAFPTIRRVAETMVND